ncbi:MAG: cysteine synthase family protein [Bacilli bacterium]|nr:cysteine synthase family protein [Bacilli bacterium]
MNTDLRNKVGNTKLIRLNNIEKKFNLNCQIYAKDESSNLTGSIKDRVALEMIEGYIERGILKEDSIIVEPTSGNTGIGLAYIGRELGYKVIIIMPSSMSEERRKLITQYGAELMLIDGPMGDCVKKAEELAKQDSRYVIMGQFENQDCVKAHYLYTGPEIIDSLKDVDIVVAGIGTGGTISGIGKCLKEYNSNIKIIGVEPFESPLINKGVAGPHKIQGIGANFIPDNYLKQYVDEVLMIKGEKSIETAKKIHHLEDVFVGISSGAALLGAIEIAKREENKGKNIVVIFPDKGDRYSWE